jgi:hypothetical protein
MPDTDLSPISSQLARIASALGPSGAVTIANLPATPTTGQRGTVTDGDSGLAWGANAVNSGSGATTYGVFWNGAQWSVEAK